MWQTPYGNADAGYGWMQGGEYWFGMAPFGLLVMIAIVVAVVWAFRASSHTQVHSGPAGEPGARELLDKRYARGEIERNEYLNRKRGLGG